MDVFNYDVTIKIRQALPTIKQMISFDTVYRCQICGVLIGEPCYNEAEAANCFPSEQEFEKAWGISLK